MTSTVTDGSSPAICKGSGKVGACNVRSAKTRVSGGSRCVVTHAQSRKASASDAAARKTASPESPVTWRPGGRMRTADYALRDGLASVPVAGLADLLTEVDPFGE